MRNMSATSDEHMEHILWLVHHEELRGYVPTTITTKELEMPDGSIEECIRLDQVIDLVSGILHAHEDGAIRSFELLQIVPHAQSLLPQLLRANSV